ncbi:MAG TPA: hypothetical protein VI895_02145 [Bdellovibrionota bacterium]|nr:hypothetical protein [Bdellovibrionota bacterium]
MRVRLISVFLAIWTFVGTMAPVNSGRVYAASNPTQIQSTVRPNSNDGPPIDIIDRLLRFIEDLLNGVSHTFRELLEILCDLFAYLGSIFVKIDDQIQSSQCHNRSCTDYGTRPH